MINMFLKYHEKSPRPINIKFKIGFFHMWVPMGDE
jgi:hypothetical protein